jgi:predicted ATPase
MSSTESPPWYVITGGPSSGKTTTINLLTERGYTVTTEQASAIIAEELAKGKTLLEVRGEGDWFQREILKRQLADEATLNRKETVFLDRGLPDGLGYERYLGLESNPELLAASQQATYRKVFLLECLPVKVDWNRHEDAQVQEEIHDVIRATYLELGFELIDIPHLSPEERVEFILARL